MPAVTKPALNKSQQPNVKHLHLDKRAPAIIAAAATGGDDDLLTTREQALWLGVSLQWLENGRTQGYGPPFTVLGPRLVRYRRGDTRKFLKERTLVAAAKTRIQAERARISAAERQAEKELA